MRLPKWIFLALHASLLTIGALLLAPLVLPVGCSSSNDAACDPSRCAAGNACIDDGKGGGPSCHLVCTSSAGCPFDYSCNDGTPKSWCVENTKVVPEAAGQWAVPCKPGDGEQGNKACDTADGFACHGSSPTDANAFCTLFDCTTDTDCPGGWWCRAENVAPNVTTITPSYGPTRLVCLPRSYCAPCKMDHDCPAAADGTQQHCIADAQGSRTCSPACTTSANCALDAVCTHWQSVCTHAAGAAPAASCTNDDECAVSSGAAQHCAGGRCAAECASDSDCVQGATCGWLNACRPRAGTCLGGGGFCAPCRSDVDCPRGYCLSGMPYSTERFCSVKSTVPTCDTTTLGPAGCPARGANDNWRGVGCTTQPPNQCEGIVTLGTSAGAQSGVPGCWSINR